MGAVDDGADEGFEERSCGVHSCVDVNGTDDGLEDGRGEALGERLVGPHALACEEEVAEAEFACDESAGLS